MNVKVISTNVGKALLVSALFMFISVMISIADGMDSAFGPLSISFIITFIAGAFPLIFVRKTETITLKDGFMIFVLAWVLSFIFGMLPYVLWGGEFSLINAWFESVSGYTTTGSTILNDVESLPKSLLFWRSSTHFIGGLGVIIFLLLIMPEASPFRLRLTNIELSSLSKEGYRYRSGRTVYVIVLVYLGLIVAETLCLMLAGMTAFDAVNHAFSTVATGGFSTKNMSVAYYGSDVIDIIIMVFMLLSSIHFGLLFSAAVTRSLKPLGQPVVRFFLGTALVLSIVVTLALKIDGGYQSWWKAGLDASFQVCSYLSTTGFATADNSAWPLFAGVILMAASIQCGCSGSTTGGLKSDRIYIAFKAIGCHVRKKLYPSSVTQIRAGNHLLKDDVALPIILYIVLYMMLMAVSALLLLLTGIDATEALSGAIASMSNAGPGLGEIGSMANFSLQPVMAKVIYTVDMFLGRVEIYPVFVVLSLIFKRDK